jgi:hypothetical protein
MPVSNERTNECVRGTLVFDGYYAGTEKDCEFRIVRADLDFEKVQGRFVMLEVHELDNFRTRANVRLDRGQALALVDAIVGPGDPTGLLTRDQAVKRIAALCRDWGVTLEELAGEQVMHALGG